MTVTFGTYDEPLITRLSQISDEALYELSIWLTHLGAKIPISQIQGFSQFAPQIARITTDETSTSTTYGDLATVGPTISLLASGHYVLLYGAAGFRAEAGECKMAPSVNGSTPSDTDAAIFGGTGVDDAGDNSATYASLADLTQDNNTVTMKYRINNAGTGHWHYRWLLALRYSNL